MSNSSTRTSKKIAAPQWYIVGLGSRMSRDDEIGLALVLALMKGRALQERYTLLESADAATVAMSLIEWRRPVILVDAADMGLNPGEHRCFSDEEAAITVKSDSVSCHGLGLAEGLSIARALGFDAPVRIFGVQPFDLSPRPGLTPEMMARLPGLMKALRGAAAAVIW